MPASERSFRLFSKSGLKFLFLELIIVFLGVYLAFLFQNYNENQKIASETEKTLIGLKEDLEYFRIFFPQYSADQLAEAERWQQLVNKKSYEDFSDWRFIQPQYNYTVIEYALEKEAGVIDFELNSELSKLYRELQKLEFTENLITEIAMGYQPLPDIQGNPPEVKLIKINNLQSLKLLSGRAVDRANIMSRIAELSKTALAFINSEFTIRERKEIELQLIKKHLEQADSITSPEQGKMFIKNYFSHLSQEEIDSIFE